MGRPPARRITEVLEDDYKYSYTESVVKLMEQGLFDYQIMASLNITPTTWKKWIKEIPEFAHAIELGTPKFINYWFTTGKEKLKAEGDKGIKTWSYIVNHLMPKYMPEFQIEKPGTTINIQNNLQNNIDKSSAELLNDIKSNFSKLWDHQQIELLEQSPQFKELLDGSKEELRRFEPSSGKSPRESEI